VSYEVFARKYRPRTFDDVVGQEHITRTLRNAIEGNRLAHAYIFVGPRGTGKTSTARILAKSLNCQSTPGPTVHPCGKCDSCREIAGGNSLDVLEFDAASNTQVDKVREIIIDNVKYAPTRGRYKVYIVDEVHMLSPSSFNALLKTLEEPPAHVKFIFATTDVQKVPTTILSRCQRFDLKRIPTAAIAGHLQMIAENEKIALAPAAAEAIARGAEGGMRDAESMLDQLVAFCGNSIAEDDVLTVFGLTGWQTVASLGDRIFEGDVAGALRIVHQEAEAGRDLSRLMSDLIGHLRNVLVAQADPESLSGELSPEAVESLTAQTGQVKPEKLLELIEQFASAEQRMRWAPNRKMHFEVALIRAIQTLGQATLSEVLETLGSIRGGGAPAPVAKAPAPVRAARPAPAAPPPKKAEEIAKPVPAKQIAAAPVTEKIAENPAPEPEPAAPAAAESPAAAAPEPPAPATPEPPKAASPPMGVDEVWANVIREVRAQRPLIKLWVEAGRLASLGNGRAVIAFPPEQTLAASYVQEKAHRPFLEDLLTQFSGQPTRLEVEMRDLAPAAAPAAAAAKDPVSEFRDDPLIRKALELFKAEIQPV
jgi:DNA polymerase-3 subunit gamma/tau